MSFAAQSQIRKPLDVELLEELEQDNSLTESSLYASSVLFPLILLAALQVADALLTLKGISVFGTSVEGNPILRFLIQATSAPVALFTVKLGCIATLAMMFSILKKNPITWVPGAIWGVNAIYIFGAIIPWACLLI